MALDEISPNPNTEIKVIKEPGNKQRKKEPLAKYYGLWSKMNR